MTFPSFCIYGPSGGGKTPQIGIWARRMFTETGGKRVGDALKGGLRTRLVTNDRGGIDSILPEIELGLIDLVDLRGEEASPWIWSAKAVQGRKPEGDGKWSRTPVNTDADGNKIGCWAFEGLTEWGQAFMKALDEQRARGESFGGGSPDLNINITDDNELFGFTGHTQTDFLIVQDEMDGLISKSMRLPGYKIWTALDHRSNDAGTGKQIVGPDVGAGKKMTAKIPQKFTYTFRTVNIAEKGGKKGEEDKPLYRLYLVAHQDPNVLGLSANCNARYPSQTPEEFKVAYIEPADIGEAYVVAKRAKEAAKEAILRSL